MMKEKKTDTKPAVLCHYGESRAERALSAQVGRSDSFQFCL